MTEPNVSRATSAHLARLERTLQDLQNRIKEQEEALEKLRETTRGPSPEPSEEPATQLQQLRQLRHVYETLTPSDPYLPPPESLLPGLLALRTTHTLNSTTSSALEKAKVDLHQATQRDDEENAHLRDAKMINTALKERIARLQHEVDNKSQRTEAQIASAMTKKLRQKRDSYESRVGDLINRFNDFIDNHLAVLLAAEELGGPVVGASLDIDDDDLLAGFSTAGRQRKLTASQRERDTDGKRQSRIDEIWGPRISDAAKEGRPMDEREAAGTEMRELSEKLLNELVVADLGGEGWVRLERESAASRFLVRSRVAVLHPKDGLRLKLVDFARGVDG